MVKDKWEDSAEVCCHAAEDWSQCYCEWHSANLAVSKSYDWDQITVFPGI